MFIGILFAVHICVPFAEKAISTLHSRRRINDTQIHLFRRSLYDRSTACVLLCSSFFFRFLVNWWYFFDVAFSPLSFPILQRAYAYFTCCIFYFDQLLNASSYFRVLWLRSFPFLYFSCWLLLLHFMFFCFFSLLCAVVWRCLVVFTVVISDDADLTFCDRLSAFL